MDLNQITRLNTELGDKTMSDIDKGKIPLSFFPDLSKEVSKAFDTLDHINILNKLYYYGIRGVCLTLFFSYLSDSIQYSMYNLKKSQ